MIITIETIPAAKMRYPTVGDWQFKPDGTLHITVSRMTDRRYEFLLALHELVEALLYKATGVPKPPWTRSTSSTRSTVSPVTTASPGTRPVHPIGGSM
jgi:hypothetical protein